MWGIKYMANEILIVDDEDRIRRLLKLYLERSFEIHEASNGKELMSLRWRITMRAFFLDLMLPKWMV